MEKPSSYNEAKLSLELNIGFFDLPDSNSVLSCLPLVKITFGENSELVPSPTFRELGPSAATL